MRIVRQLAMFTINPVVNIIPASLDGVGMVFTRLLFFESRIIEIGIYCHYLANFHKINQSLVWNCDPFIFTVIYQRL